MAMNASRDEGLALAIALEARSEHPLARAIVAAVDTVVPAAPVEAVPGTGLTGDNIRTAAALAAEVAIETAAVALMGEDLRHLPQALAHARRSRRIILQNVGLSLAIITGMMPLALLGILGLAAVVLVHEVAEVFVIANGARAGRARPLDATVATTPQPAPA